MNITPENIQKLQRNQIFVFGSNLAGRHGAGAALLARQWGAIDGIGEGLAGQTYAIPTKDFKLNTLPLLKINECVARFFRVAEQNQDLHFLVTAIGCGLAGYFPKDIAPMFHWFLSMENVSLPESFLQVVQK